MAVLQSLRKDFAAWTTRLPAWIETIGEWWFDATRQLNATRPVWVILWTDIALSALIGSTAPGRDLVAAPFVDEPPDWYYAAPFLIGVTLFALGCWWWSRETITRAFGSREKWQPQWLWLWLPRALAMLPFAGLLSALAAAGTSGLKLSGIGGIAALVLLFTITRRWLFNQDGVLRPKAGRRIIVAANVFGLFWFVAFYFSPIDLPWRLGAPIVAVVGAFSALAGLMALYRVFSYCNPLANQFTSRSDRFAKRSIAAPPRATGTYRFLPVLSILVLISLLVEVIGDEHRIQPNSFPSNLPFAGKPGFRQAYEHWLARGNRSTSPVIVVAAAGGANRASYWTQLVLSKLERNDDRFRRAVFAISGVSGGSVGAAAWVAAAKPLDPAGTGPPGMLDRDLLAPLLAALFFTDLPHFDRLGRPDRQQQFEQGLEQGWSLAGEKRHGNPFEEPFLKLSPLPGDWQPLLFINGARVEDGRRIITAPIAVTNDIFADALDFHDIVGGDVKLSTALSNGDRFPLVSPPGLLRTATGEPAGHIVDGGYFENGGVETAAEIMAGLKALGHTGPIVFIEINADDTEDDAARIARPPPRRPWTCCERRQVEVHDFAGLVLNELWLPIFGLYESRSGRGWQSALRVARQQLDAAGVDKRGKHIAFQLPMLRSEDGELRPTPLDWTLPLRTRKLMRGELDSGRFDEKVAAVSALLSPGETGLSDDQCSLETNGTALPVSSPAAPAAPPRPAPARLRPAPAAS